MCRPSERDSTGSERGSRSHRNNAEIIVAVTRVPSQRQLNLEQHGGEFRLGTPTHLTLHVPSEASTSRAEC